MLIELRVTNFRSFRETQVFSMVASSDRKLLDQTVAPAGLARLRLNTCAVVFGANASGKSNLIEALALVRRLVLSFEEAGGWRLASLTDADTDKYFAPFLLDETARAQPSEFEVLFVHGGVRYQYGFRIDAQVVHAEWLIAYPTGQPQRWFERTRRADGGYDWEFRSRNFRGEKQRITEVTREDTLYMAVGPQFGLEQLLDLQRWFADLTITFPGPLYHRNSRTSRRAAEDPAFLAQLTDLLRHADVGIVDVQIEEEGARTRADGEEPRPSRAAPTYEVRFAHAAAAGQPPHWLPFRAESRGTRQLFEMAYAWLTIIERGGVLVADELDTSLHPLLTRRVVELFHDLQVNRHGAQLIFNTHDVTLLDRTLFRRDQIWFTEKDRAGATRLYPLLEFSPRNDEALERGYLGGRYGATPYVERLVAWKDDHGAPQDEA